MSSGPRVLLDRTLDPERDCHAVAVAVPDYNGHPAVTVFFTGYPVMICEPNDGPGYTSDRDQGYRFTHIISAPDAEDFSPHEQSAVALMYHLGELPEGEHQAYLARHLTAMEVLEYADGHELVAFQGEIARAVHEAYPEITPVPRGW